MRTWILALMLYSATAISVDIQPSSKFLDHVVASSPRSSPFAETGRLNRSTPAKCCKVCTKGKPCGDTCIAQDKTCHVGPGCAC